MHHPRVLPRKSLLGSGLSARDIALRWLRAVNRGRPGKDSRRRQQSVLNLFLNYYVRDCAWAEGLRQNHKGYVHNEFPVVPGFGGTDVARRCCGAQPSRLEVVAALTTLSSCPLLDSEQLDLGPKTASGGHKRAPLACSVLEQVRASLVEPTSLMASAIALPVGVHVCLGRHLRKPVHDLDCLFRRETDGHTVG